jgi:hypothetical protein
VVVGHGGVHLLERRSGRGVAVEGVEPHLDHAEGEPKNVGQLKIDIGNS